MLLALPVALVAGLVSFFSPCVIPLLPGYLSYATGISGADLRAGPPRPAGARRGPLRARLLGRLRAPRQPHRAAGAWLFTHVRELNVVLGVIMILLGHRVPRRLRRCSSGTGASTRSPRSGWRPPRCSASSSASAGCRASGPTLAAINVLSVDEATAARGALLSAVFALGLGLPFIAAALAYRRMLGAFAVIRRHQVLVVRLGGAMMILVGLLLVSGWWDRIVQWLQLQVVQGFAVPV